MRRGVAALMVTVALISTPTMTATAVELFPATARASLADIATGNIHVVLTPGNPYDDKPSRPIAGVPVGIKKLDFDLNSPDDIALLEQATMAELVEKAANLPFFLIENTDHNGEVTFRDLSAGIYLVASPLTDADFHPLVVSVPAWDKETKTWRATAEARPKPRPKSPEPAPYLPPRITTVDPLQSVPSHPATEEQHRNKGLGRLAQTGASVLGVVGIALALLVLGVMIVRRNKRN
ncbi:LPXTG cell wall anchor domain-containing protein [Corynebacterium hindlerae]|uniref:LPXTG cell wall anchor domain-containing protein n=1 Tax=Corynebacterium hindlerae TaxID=699041 RepID=UPI001AD6FB97|nr:LPXTG cell wall anchor domain-containing protein [Corynebacterium hindlerae]QTH59599.1 LPXTG cell wall anchor domain-containing protein [Corynebacterium hindlerae]